MNKYYFVFFLKFKIRTWIFRFPEFFYNTNRKTSELRNVCKIYIGRYLVFCKLNNRIFIQLSIYINNYNKQILFEY